MRKSSGRGLGVGEIYWLMYVLSYHPSLQLGDDLAVTVSGSRVTRSTLSSGLSHAISPFHHDEQRKSPVKFSEFSEFSGGQDGKKLGPLALPFVPY